jgi:hypothetical protein
VAAVVAEVRRRDADRLALQRSGKPLDARAVLPEPLIVSVRRDAERPAAE